jgi:rhodanese-related sulfurtransferase
VNIFIFVSQEWLLISILFALIAILAMITRKNNGMPIVTRDLVQLMNQDQAVLIDIRSTNDFNQAHIHGAINIPHNKLADRISELEKFKAKTLVIADQMGQHAGAAGAMLFKQGYQVRRLSGGLSSWRHDNLPLVSGNKN